MTIVLSICGVALLLLIIFVFGDSLIDVILIVLLVLFFMGKCRIEENDGKVFISIGDTVRKELIEIRK